MLGRQRPAHCSLPRRLGDLHAKHESHQINCTHLCLQGSVWGSFAPYCLLIVSPPCLPGIVTSALPNYEYLPLCRQPLPALAHLHVALLPIATGQLGQPRHNKLLPHCHLRQQLSRLLQPSPRHKKKNFAVAYSSICGIRSIPLASTQRSNVSLLLEH